MEDDAVMTPVLVMPSAKWKTVVQGREECRNQAAQVASRTSRPYRLKGEDTEETEVDSLRMRCDV